MKALLITLLTIISLSTSAATLRLHNEKPVTISVKKVSGQVQFGNQLAVTVIYDKNITKKNCTLEVYKVLTISTANKRLKKVKYIYVSGNRYFLMTSKNGTVGYIED